MTSQNPASQDPASQDPESRELANGEAPRPSRWASFAFRRIMTAGLALGAVAVIVAALCSAPEIIAEVTPPEPTPMPTAAPTWTPVPTWTPAPPPTATPHPLASIPEQQAHYQEYRVFHLVHEYTLCYRAHVQPPPAPVSTPTTGPTPEYHGNFPTEPWRDDPRFLAPTQAPRPTAAPAGFPGQHRPLGYGATDAELEDHALADLGAATRWLIERYRSGDCEELTQFTVFPGRLVWLNRYAAQ